MNLQRVTGPTWTQAPANSRYQGRRVAVVGLGVENLPLVRWLLRHGAAVVACDRKSPEQLGESRYRELAEVGVVLRLGEGYLQGLGEGVDEVFLTPGIPKHLPELEACRQAGVRFNSQMNLFFELCPAPIVGITGSSGKTTTTTLVGGMLAGTGRQVLMGGNIGEPLIERLPEIRPDAWVVLELSSFQLEMVERSPHGATVTNITPNHLDVHASMEEYVAAKSHIFRWQRGGDFAIFNADNPTTVEMARQAPARTYLFSRRQPLELGAWVERESVVVRVPHPGVPPAVVCRTDEIRLLGVHNLENVLAASAMAVLCGAPVEAVREVATRFEGVPHRLELVAEIGGVRFYNDSIATSPARAIAGLRSFEAPVVLIAGGYDKHLPFDEFAEVAVERCRAVVVLGATAAKIEAAIRRAAEAAGREVPTTRARSFEEAVQMAAGLAQAGDVVLLSPACASYDMFRNFEERGQRFRELARELAARGGASAGASDGEKH